MLLSGRESGSNPGPMWQAALGHRIPRAGAQQDTHPCVGPCLQKLASNCLRLKPPVGPASASPTNTLSMWGDTRAQEAKSPREQVSLSQEIELLPAFCLKVLSLSPMHKGASGSPQSVPVSAIFVSSPLSLISFWLPFCAKGQKFPSHAQTCDVCLSREGHLVPTTHTSTVGAPSPPCCVRSGWAASTFTQPRGLSLLFGSHTVLVVISIQVASGTSYDLHSQQHSPF